MAGVSDDCEKCSENLTTVFGKPDRSCLATRRELIQSFHQVCFIEKTKKWSFNEMLVGTSGI